jgi:hypothetical protein
MRRDDILKALAALGADLAGRGLVADLYVVGGVAIALAYDERRATRDVSVTQSCEWVTVSAVTHSRPE